MKELKVLPKLTGLVKRTLNKTDVVANIAGSGEKLKEVISVFVNETYKMELQLNQKKIK